MLASQHWVQLLVVLQQHYVCFIKMQPNGIYHLTIHPCFLEWWLRYYLCSNLSYTSHLQLHIVQLSSTEAGEKFHLPTSSNLLFFFFNIQQLLQLFYFRQHFFSFRSSQPSVAVYIFRKLYSHLERFYFFVMFIPCTFQISVNIHGNSCYNTLHSCAV